MGCCGGAAQSVPRQSRGTSRPQITGDRVAVAYVGPRKGDFWVTGQVSRVRYHIMGRGEFLTDDRGRVGVDRRDVKPLTSMNRGRNFKVIQPPAPPQTVPETSEAWKPAAMEEQRIVGMDASRQSPSDLTIKQLRALEGQLTAEDAFQMLLEERDGKNRLGAIRFLEGITNES